MRGHFEVKERYKRGGKRGQEKKERDERDGRKTPRNKFLASVFLS